MRVYECVFVERKAVRYRVEANTPEEADEILQASDSREYIAEQWPLDTEEAEPWHVLPATVSRA